MEIGAHQRLQLALCTHAPPSGSTIVQVSPEHTHSSGAMQFQPMLVKGQVYTLSFLRVLLRLHSSPRLIAEQRRTERRGSGYAPVRSAGDILVASGFWE